jgi:OOP family OmpA-OmpF porin
MSQYPASHTRSTLRAKTAASGQHRTHRLALACLAALSAHGVMAAPYAEPAQLDESYYYGGASVGQSRSHLHTPGMTAQLLGNSATATTIEQDKQDTTYKVFGGYQFNRYVAAEIGFFDLGKYKFTAQTVPPGTLSGEVKIRGFNLDVVGTWPMTDACALLGRVGAQSAKTSETFSTTGAAISSANQLHKHQVDVKAGVGVQYALAPSALLRAEIEHYRVSDGLGQRNGVNALTIGVVFPFGRAETRPARVVVTPDAPRPVAKRDEPEPPIMAAAPVIPPKQRVSLSAESLFAFDKSQVQPAGQATLGKFATDLAGAQYDTITVEGHTDRLGSSGYNDALSQRRADAVKAYLVDQQGIEATKVSSVGKSESDPVTKPGDCTKNLKRPALIACLSPDRRVEIEVSGRR